MISRYLSVPEWAKACGTCRAMQSVQPAAIVAQPRSVAELCWVAKRWQRARFIKISLETLCRRIAGKTCAGSPKDELPLPELQALIFKQAAAFWHLKELSANLGKKQYAVSPKGWLIPILAQSAQLRIVQLISHQPIMLPVMDQLTHLFMTCHCMPERCTDTIRTLPRLRVLVLRVNQFGDDCSELGLGDEKGLDLRQCKELHALVLDKFMPQSLQCPAGCSVCIRGQSNLCATAWRYMRKTCTGCHLEHFCTNVGFPDLTDSSQLPRMLAMESCTLIYLSIGSPVLGSTLGREQNPLLISDTLPSLKHLRIYSRGSIIVRFSQAVRLKSVSLKCKEMLRVAFDDVKAFAQSLEDAVLSWREGRGIKALLRALARHGKNHTLDMASGVYAATLGCPLPACRCYLCAACLMHEPQDATWGHLGSHC